MPDVRMPDGVVVRFPDNMPPDLIRSLITRKFPALAGGVAPQSQAQPQAPSMDFAGPTGDVPPDLQAAAAAHADQERAAAQGQAGPRGDALGPTAPSGPNYADAGGVSTPPANMGALSVLAGGQSVPGAVKTPYNPDTDGSIADPIAEGFTFGFNGEITGVIGGLIAVAKGRPFNEGYDLGQKITNDRLSAYREREPVLSAIGEVGGGLATMAVPGLGGANVFRGAGLIPRAANAAVTGAAYGGLYGAGTADGGLADRAMGAATGAATGLVAGAAAPVATSAIGGVARTVAAPVRALMKPGDQAAKRVETAFARDQVDPAQAAAALQAAQASGTPMVAGDLGDETVRALARSAANTSPEARSTLQAATDGRLETQKPRFIEFVRSLVGGANATKTREQLLEMAQKANGPAYRRAYEAGDTPLMSPELERLTGSPDVVRAMMATAEKGKSRAIADGYGAFNTNATLSADGRVVFTKGKGGVPTDPNIQFWDYTYRELRDAGTAAAAAGRTGEASYLRDLSKTMRSELDRLVPEYGQARSQAALFFGAEDALDAGEKFVISTRGNDEARAVIAKMNPAERTLFREGFASSLVASVREVGDRTNLINATFAKSSAARERIELALGAQEARAVEAFLRTEHTFDLLRRAVQGNSTTARQLVELGLAGGVGVTLAGGNVFDPKAWLTGALLYTARRGGALIDQRVARRVGEMLASDDPKVFQNAIKIASRNPGMLNLLRLTEQNFARLVGPAEGGYAAAAQEGQDGAPGQGRQ